MAQHKIVSQLTSSNIAIAVVTGNMEPEHRKVSNVLGMLLRLFKRHPI